MNQVARNLTDAVAWLLDGVSAIEEVTPYSVGITLTEDVTGELDSSFVLLLDGTADHGRATSGVVQAMALIPTIWPTDISREILRLYSIMGRMSLRIRFFATARKGLRLAGES